LVWRGVIWGGESRCQKDGKNLRLSVSLRIVFRGKKKPEREGGNQMRGERVIKVSTRWGMGWRKRETIGDSIAESEAAGRDDACYLESLRH